MGFILVSFLFVGSFVFGFGKVVFVDPSSTLHADCGQASNSSCSSLSEALLMCADNDTIFVAAGSKLFGRNGNMNLSVLVNVEISSESSKAEIDFENIPGFFYTTVKLVKLSNIKIMNFKDWLIGEAGGGVYFENCEFNKIQNVGTLLNFFGGVVIKNSVFANNSNIFSFYNSTLEHFNITNNEFRDNVGRHFDFENCSGTLEFSGNSFTGGRAYLSIVNSRLQAMSNNNTFSSSKTQIFLDGAGLMEMVGDELIGSSESAISCDETHLTLNRVFFKDNLNANGASSVLLKLCTAKFLNFEAGFLQASSYPQIGCVDSYVEDDSPNNVVAPFVDCVLGCNLVDSSGNNIDCVTYGGGGLTAGLIVLIIFASVLGILVLVLVFVYAVHCFQKNRKRMSYRDLDIQDENNIL